MKKINQYLKNQTLFFAPGNIYCIDIEGRYQACNETAAKLLNLNSPDEIIGKTLVELVDEKFHDLAEKVMKEDKGIMLAGDEVVFEEEGFDQFGKIVTYLTTKKPIIVDDEVIGMVGTSVDISVTKKLQNDLNVQKKTTDIFKALTHTIAHEARTPLASANIACRVLTDKLNAIEGDDGARAEIFSLIGKIKTLCSNTNKLIGLHTDIHKLDNLSLNSFDRLSAHQIITNAIESYPFRDDSERQAIQIELENDFSILGNEELLTHVVWNIIKNALYAIQAANDGALKIKTKVEEKVCSITFEDNATGIPKEIQNKIFDIYFTNKSSGTGIGLYFCKQVMNVHEGDIECFSKNGITRFTLSFPCSKK